MKKWVVIFMCVALMCSVALLSSQDVKKEVKKEVPKKALKLMNEALALTAKDKDGKPADSIKIDQAIELLKQAIKEYPDYDQAYYNLGIYLWQRNFFDDGIVAIEASLKINKDNKFAAKAYKQMLYEHSRYLCVQKQYEKSNGLVQKALEFCDYEKEDARKYSELLYVKGNNLFQLKNYPDAIAVFTKFVQIPTIETINAQTYPNCVYYLGIIHSIINEYPKANEYFLKYLEMYKGKEQENQFVPQINYLVASNMFHIMEEKGKAEGKDKVVDLAKSILPFINKALELKFIKEDVYVLLGNCHVYCKDLDSAIATYKQIIELYPQSPEIDTYKKFLKDLENAKNPPPPAKPAKKKKK